MQGPDDDMIELPFTRDQLVLIQRAAAARGSTVHDFILRESLTEAHRLLGPTPASAPQAELAG